MADAIRADLGLDASASIVHCDGDAGDGPALLPTTPAVYRMKRYVFKRTAPVPPPAPAPPSFGAISPGDTVIISGGDFDGLLGVATKDLGGTAWAVRLPGKERAVPFPAAALRRSLFQPRAGG